MWQAFKLSMVKSNVTNNVAQNVRNFIEFRTISRIIGTLNRTWPAVEMSTSRIHNLLMRAAAAKMQ
jgi:hypothetical protein